MPSTYPKTPEGYGADYVTHFPNQTPAYGRRLCLRNMCTDRDAQLQAVSPDNESQRQANPRLPCSAPKERGRPMRIKERNTSVSCLVFLVVGTNIPVFFVYWEVILIFVIHRIFYLI